MLTETEYLRFQIQPEKPRQRSRVWTVTSKYHGTMLGVIRWWTPWRQYCFFPAPTCVFNYGCLTDIATFLKTIMEARKQTHGDTTTALW